MLKVLLFILLIYFGIKILSRIFAPLLIKYFTNKAAERFGGFQNHKQPEPKKDGEISIDKIPKSKTSNKKVGEYVDFEEVD